MDEFEKWIEANYQSMPTNRRELSEFAFKAGRKAGMREAIRIIRREQKQMTDPVFWATAILAAIGEGK